MHRTPFHVCSELLSRLVLHYRNISAPKCSVGDRLGRKSSVSHGTGEHEATAQGQPSREVTVLCKMAFQFWRGEVERNIRGMLTKKRRGICTPQNVFIRVSPTPQTPLSACWSLWHCCCCVLVFWHCLDLGCWILF